MSNYRWIKYRTLHSSGPGPWDYREIGVPDDPTKAQLDEELKEALHSLDYELNTQSEHWRGIEADYEDPPIEFLRRHIRRCQERAKAYRSSMKRADMLIHKINRESE